MAPKKTNNKPNGNKPNGTSTGTVLKAGGAIGAAMGVLGLITGASLLPKAVVDAVFAWLPEEYRAGACGSCCCCSCSMSVCCVVILIFFVMKKKN